MSDRPSAELLVALRAELERLCRRSEGPATGSADPVNLPLDAAALKRCALDACEDELCALRDRSPAGVGRAASLLALARRLESAERSSRSAITAEGLSELAHKMNNPLTAILGRAQILRARPGQDPGVLKAAGVIEGSAQSLAALVRELGALAKDGRELASVSADRPEFTRA